MVFYFAIIMIAISLMKGSQHWWWDWPYNFVCLKFNYEEVWIANGCNKNWKKIAISVFLLHTVNIIITKIVFDAQSFMHSRNTIYFYLSRFSIYITPVMWVHFKKWQDFSVNSGFGFRCRVKDLYFLQPISLYTDSLIILNLQLYIK